MMCRVCGRVARASVWSTCRWGGAVISAQKFCHKAVVASLIRGHRWSICDRVIRPGWDRQSIRKVVCDGVRYQARRCCGDASGKPWACGKRRSK